MDIIEIYKKEMLDKKNWAIIGVTKDKNKFGYKIWKLLKARGYNVFGINPKYNEIDGEKIYDSINSLPVVPEVVNMVVNPNIALLQLDQVMKNKIEYVWFQPGTIDEIVLDKAELLNLKIVYYECVYADLLNQK